ncbi:MAG: glycine--tRNA ligase, partial [Candidatus Latescibacteria bacterium]|nr:glycine--tRNA ligase [Candidatus Latescibacterota bacterium]
MAKPKKNKMPVKMEKLMSLCKRRGFIFQSSEIYGGQSACWDFGPLGVELKNNIKRLWWKAMVQENENIVGLDAAIIMHPRVWEASGHVEGFHDPMVDCKDCKRRFRADNIEGDKCPECGGELTGIRQFNLMFKTHIGPVEDSASVAYLRPETAQGIYVNFLNVVNSSRQNCISICSNSRERKMKLPGVISLRKAFP